MQPPPVTMPAMAGFPKESLSAVRDYASDTVGCSSERITAVTRFEDGNRHAVHRVSYLDPAGVTRDVVVRVSYGGGAADCAQAEREAAVLEKLGGVAAPFLYDFRCTSPWFDTPAMCMGFVRGRQRELNSASLGEIERLASIVAWLHERPTGDLVEPLAETGNIASYAEGRLQSILFTLASARDPLPAALQARLIHAADAIATSWEASQDAPSFKTGESLALLHGDIGPGNVLWGPDPVLIDWEYTRLGDPADEIAYLFDQNALTEPQRQAFWDGYRQSVSSQSRLGHVIDRVDWWEPVTLLGSALWWVERWVRRTELDIIGAVDPAVPREPAYYFDHVIRRLVRLEKPTAD
jgi:aminoglycoside phosphotransferase (APT) family kinase protein